MSSFLNSMISTTAGGHRIRRVCYQHFGRASSGRAPGEHATAIAGFTLYRRTATPPCYPATYEPNLNVSVQGRKHVSLGGTTYLCDESTFLLSSIDVPVARQTVAASEEVPLRSLLLKLHMSMAWRNSQSRRNSDRAMVHRKLVASRSGTLG